MSSAADTFATKPVKMAIASDSGAGKSGSIVSLLLTGKYRIRTIDADDGLDIVVGPRGCLKDPASPYYPLAQKLDLSDVFRFETVNHKMITLDTGKQIRIQPQAATVWPKVQNLVHEWRESPTIGPDGKPVPGPNLGKVSSWGDDTILVLDSSTFTSWAAFAYQQQMGSHLGADTSGNTWRRDIGAAQEYMQSLLRLLCSDAIKCHVIVMCHINYLHESFEKDSDSGSTRRIVSSNASDVFGVTRAYPTWIGRALGPISGRYFNNVLEMKVEGSGRAAKRKIYTVPTGSIAVKTSAPFSLRESYDISTGLAEIFAILRGQPEPRDLLAQLNKPKLTPNVGPAKPASPVKPPFTPVPRPDNQASQADLVRETSVETGTSTSLLVDNPVSAE